MFERVARLLESKQPAERLGRNSEYLLRGALRCACGAAMTPASTRKAATEYRYYRCVRREKAGREACDDGPISAGAIEEHVVAQLRGSLSFRAWAPDAMRSLQLRLATERADVETERTALPPRIAAAEAEIERLRASLAGLTGAARKSIEGRLEEAGST